MKSLQPPETGISKEALVICIAICVFIISMVIIFIWILCFLWKLRMPRVDSISLEDYIAENAQNMAVDESEKAAGARDGLVRVPTIRQTYLAQLGDVDGGVAEDGDVEKETDPREMDTGVSAFPQFFLDPIDSSDKEPDEEENCKVKR